MRPTTHSIALTLFGFTAGAAVVFGLERLPPITAAPSSASDAASVPGAPAAATATVRSAGFADAVAAAAPAVVKVYGRSDPPGQRRAADTVARPIAASAGVPRVPAARQMRLGSGVVIAPNGLIVTNGHVVRDLTRIEVELIDGRRAQADLVGIDEATDLALLRVPLKDLPTIKIGDPARLRSGDVVLAIGNPFGIGQTVSLGIVSGTGRSQLGLTAVEDFIQTDAAINPGSSGGALVDSDGRLVGIATAGVSESGHSEGVGLAIPSTLVMQVVDALSDRAPLARVWIGIGGRSVTTELEERFGLRTSRGVLVSTLAERGPAAAAGLRAGDVITGLNGAEIDDALQLQGLLAEATTEREIRLRVLRGSEELELPLRIGPAVAREGGEGPNTATPGGARSQASPAPSQRAPSQPAAPHSAAPQFSETEPFKPHSDQRQVQAPRGTVGQDGAAISRPDCLESGRGC
jgi:serine protease DegS